MFSSYDPFVEQIKMRFLCLNVPVSELESSIHELESTDCFSVLTASEKKRFITSIEGTFRFFVLPAINQQALSLLYSSKDYVRPAKYALIHAAAKLYCECMDIRQEYFLSHIHSDQLIQFAIGTFGMRKQPFSSATFNRFDQRLYQYYIDTNRDIWDEITHTIDMALAQEMGLLTSSYGRYKYRLRMDSLMVNGYGAAMTRLDIAYECNAQMVKTIAALGCECYLPTGVCHYLERDDHNQTIYFKGTLRELKKEGLDSVEDEVLRKEIKKSQQKRKEVIASHRLAALLKESHVIIQQCEGTPLESLVEYKALVRMFNDQANSSNNTVIPKSNKEISSTSLQTPYDPDITCRFKQGKFYRGYSGVFTEIYDKRGNGIIIYRALEQNIHTDIQFMQEFFDKHDPALNLDVENNERAVISVDAGFVSDFICKTGEQLGFDIVCAGVPGGAPDPIFAEFKLSNDEEKIIQCPSGHPIDTNISNTSGVFVIHFNERYCLKCPHSEQCGAVTTGVNDDGSFRKRGSSTVKVSIPMIKAATCLRQIKDKTNPELIELINRRNAVEGIPSVLRRFFDVDSNPKPGIFWARNAYYSKVSGNNIRKLHGYLQVKMKELRSKNKDSSVTLGTKPDCGSESMERYEQLYFDFV